MSTFFCFQSGVAKKLVRVVFVFGRGWNFFWGGGHFDSLATTAHGGCGEKCVQAVGSSLIVSHIFFIFFHSLVIFNL